MIRLLYFTDSHIRGTSPRARTDVYPEALKTKLREVLEIARAKQCDAVICGGDLFDSPDPQPIVVREFARILRTWDCPIYVCPGNHEIYGYNLDSIPRTMLGLLAEFGVVQILTNSIQPYVLHDHEFTIYITGQGFYHDIDRNPQDYMVEEISNHIGYHVHVVHGMLVKRPLPYEATYTLIKDCETNADVILSGHEHLGYGLVQRKDGVWFCNPGALGRISAKVEEMYRQVKVALFEFDADGIRAELIPLESAKSGIEVLSRDHLTQLAEREDRMQRFLSLLAEEGESRLLEVREIVDDIARRENLPAAVRDEALARLSAAREALAQTA